MLNVTQVLGDNGSLKKVFPNFTPRQAQLDMALAVENTISDNGTAVIEAGTGIGKTFAYLVPALLSKKKVLISTGTKNLQDQLYRKDLPLLRKLFPVSKITILKGRSNYLCLYRLETHASDTLYESRSALKDLTKVNRWAKITDTGDVAELSTLKETSSVWPNVTSTSDNCLGSDCPCFDKCFVAKARKQALASDVVIVNHHLFFADLAIKEEGFGQLLPDAGVVVFDEAHHLLDVATSFFSDSLSSRKILTLVNDVLAAYCEIGQDLDALPELLSTIKQSLKKVRLALGEDMRREAWEEVASKRDVKKSLEYLNEQVLELVSLLDHLSQRSKELQACYERSVTLSHLFVRLLEENQPKEFVYWFETFMQSFVIHITPIEIQDEMSDLLDQPNKAWIFTSATLAIQDCFEFFLKPLGIKADTQKQLASPYRYDKNTVLFVPQGLPDVRSVDFISSLVEFSLPIIEKGRGRTFMLFTSYSAMHKAHEFLVKTDFTLLMQGEKTKYQLLQEFREEENAILLGTSSFWQGVDVQGDALSCVVIDKLPFASPGEPLVKARINAMRRKGGNPFFDYQLPHAIIALKQGVGRLIRSEKDKGVLIIGDMRLLTKNYGKQFLCSLPDIPIRRQNQAMLEDCDAYFSD